MSVDYEGLTAEHRDLVAIQKRIGDAMEEGRWHSAAREIVGLFRMSRAQPAPEPAKTDPRHPGFATWEPCAAPAPSAATEPAVAESYRGADCLNMIGAVIDYYGQAFIVTSHGCSQLLGHPHSLACGHATPSAITFLRWATREECERHGIPYVERGRAPSPAASPAAYVPKCGDVVALTVCDVTGDALPHRDSLGAHLYRVESDKPDHSEYFKCVRVDGRDTTSPCFISARGMRPATAAERVAAGLDAPAVDREAFTTLLDAVKWVLNDAAFKAPEQMGEVAERWVARLERAIDSLPPSLTKGGAS